jgi:hypothetical protein
MFQFKHDFQDYFVGIRDINATKALHPGLQSFQDWLSKNGSRIPKD